MKKVVSMILVFVILASMILSSCSKNNATKPTENDSYIYVSSEENYVFEEGVGLFINNEVIISATSSATKEEIDNLVSEFGGTVKGHLTSTNTFQIVFDERYSYEYIKSMNSELVQSSFVEDAAPNLVIPLEYLNSKVEPFPNDENWKDKWDSSPSGGNWGMEAIKARDAWNYRDNMQSVNVGLIDGDFFAHDDLHFEEVPLAQKSDYSIDNPAHGVHVAGTMAAELNNDCGVSGIIPEANLYGASFEGMRHRIGTENEIKISDIAFKYALEYLIAKKHCRVVNISMGLDFVVSFAASRGNKNALGCVNDINSSLDAYLTKLLNNGNDFLVVKGAGNQWDDKYKYRKDESSVYGFVEDENGDLYGRVDAKYDFLSGIENPAIKERIIVVGAYENTSTGFRIWDGSLRGERVDVLAPGVDIESLAVLEDGTSAYGTATGTSMATPHVSGMSALAFSINPTLSAVEVKEIVCSSYSQQLTDELGNICGLPRADLVVDNAMNYQTNDLNVRESEQSNEPPVQNDATSAEFTQLEEMFGTLTNSFNCKDAKSTEMALAILLWEFGTYSYYFDDKETVFGTDPLNAFVTSGFYHKYPAESVDWILKNAFNVTPDHRYYAEEINEYGRTLVMGYYKDGYYYVPGVDMGFARGEMSVSSYRKDESGTYHINMQASENWEGDMSQKYCFYIVAKLVEIDGRKIWSFEEITMSPLLLATYESDYSVRCDNGFKSGKQRVIIREISENIATMQYQETDSNGVVYTSTEFWLDLDCKTNEVQWKNNSGDVFNATMTVTDTELYSNKQIECNVRVESFPANKGVGQFSALLSRVYVY